MTILGRALIQLSRRNFSTSLARRGGDQGIRGETLPFDIKNRHKLMVMFIVFFGSAFSFPFLLVRHHALKKANSG